MISLEPALRAIAAALTDLGVRWALVGGLAVSARTEPRFTRDIDVAVAVQNDSDAESLIHALRQRGYEIFSSVEHQRTNRLATIRMTAPADRTRAKGVVIDLLFASSGIEFEIAHGAEEVTVLPGLRLPVARVGDLIATKLLARDDRRRPQDIADLRALLAEATQEERARVAVLIALISARLSNRGRDLQAAWAELQRDV